MCSALFYVWYFFKVSVLIYTPQQWSKIPNAWFPCQHLCFHFIYFGGIILVSHWTFNFYFPNDWWYWAPFSVLTGFWKAAFFDILIWAFCPFFYCIFVFIINLQEFVRWYGWQSFVKYMYCKYLLPLFGLPVHFQSGAFWQIEILNSNIVQPSFIVSSLWLFYLWLFYSKKYLLEDIFPCFRLEILFFLYFDLYYI